MLKLVNRISSYLAGALLLVMIFLISCVGMREPVLKALGWPTFAMLLITFGTFLALKFRKEE